MAPFQQGVVDELGPVVAVYAQKREREGAPDVRQRLESPFAGLVRHGAQLRPAGIHVRRGQGEQEFAGIGGSAVFGLGFYFEACPLLG